MLNREILLGCDNIRKITSTSGDMLWRHPSGMGSVIESADVRVLVLDAAWRKRLAFANPSINGVLYGLPQVPNTNNHDPNTSRWNCDHWLTYSGNLPAIRYTRSLAVDGSFCDVPNINVCKLIRSDREAIDELDPTLANYPGLSIQTIFQSMYHIRSSSYYGVHNGAYSNWYVEGFSEMYWDQTHEYWITPVLEL